MFSRARNICQSEMDIFMSAAVLKLTRDLGSTRIARPLIHPEDGRRRVSRRASAGSLFNRLRLRGLLSEVFGQPFVARRAASVRPGSCCVAAPARVKFVHA